MEVGEKPFPCKTAGCKASFATEDHLNAHQARHEESGMLNLELPNKSNLFADQTPTPTRLIGKCEEVGLFEDLQNVNPFEETFRRAVEEKSEAGVDGGETGKAATTPAVGTGDDTLHTPHVFPLLERRESIKERNYKLSKLFIARSVSRKDEVGSSQPPTTAATDLKRKANDAKVLIAPKKVPVAILPKETPVQPDTALSLSGASSDTDPDPVKVKLKKYLARNGTLVDASKSIPKKVAKQSTDTTKITKLPEQPLNNLQQEDKEKAEKHERWKAAAKRYRTRLKQNQDLIAQRNVTLEEENARLKAEVVRLRNLLQLHRDCPVARGGGALSTGAGAALVTAAGPSKVQLQQQPTAPVYIVIAAAGSPPLGTVMGAVAAQNHPPEKRS